ncbi:hypothetical protein AB0J28_13580 [Streptosporangium canum]
MTRLFSVAKSDGCTSDCRNGQIWNPGSGPYPCPICKTNAGANGGTR